MDIQKEKRAIETLKAFNKNDEPYYVCYSGGKDYDVIRILSELSNVNYELHNNHTTVDSPITVNYIRGIMSKYGDKKRIVNEKGEVIYQYGDKGFIHLPKESMWELIVRKKYPPTRLARFCCAELKEKGGKSRRKVTGVRWQESNNRKNNQGLVTIIGQPKNTIKTAEDVDANFTLTKKGGVVLNTDNDNARRVVESCYRTTSTLINPIIDWTDDDVWEFLHHYGCKSNPEYCNGSKRVGCIGCPIAGGKQQKKEFETYPKYRQAYVNAFQKMLDARKKDGKETFDIDKGWYWRDGEAVMRWWVGDDPLQITQEDYMAMLELEHELMEEYT